MVIHIHWTAFALELSQYYYCVNPPVRNLNFCNHSHVILVPTTTRKILIMELLVFHSIVIKYDFRMFNLISIH